MTGSRLNCILYRRGLAWGNLGRLPLKIQAREGDDLVARCTFDIVLGSADLSPPDVAKVFLDTFPLVNIPLTIDDDLPPGANSITLTIRLEMEFAASETR